MIPRHFARGFLGPALFLVAASLAAPRGVSGDTVVMKNGIVYRGSVDKDNTLVWVFDGLKRIVLRDSKIARTESNPSFGNWEWFKLVQPLVQHAGAMPREVIAVREEPWNEKGRRMFGYVTTPTKPWVRMEQAIYEMGPYLVKVRGVDGFWQDGRLATSQVPREIVLGLLGKVLRDNQNERLRVVRFLIQAEWYAEARAELADIARRFPDLEDTVAKARASIVQLEAAQLKAELDLRRKAQQYHEVATRLKTFPSKEVGSELLVDVRDQLRQDEAQAASDQALAEDLLALAGRLSKSDQTAWRPTVVEIVRALGEAPDAVRDRLVAWRKARLDGEDTPETLFALAASGYLVGADAGVADLRGAATLREARGLVHDYLASRDAPERADRLDKLQRLEFPEVPTIPAAVRALELVSRLATRMPPPLHRESDVPGTPKINRVGDDDNEAPTEYTVLLPPEYHPLRSYPAVVALHDGRGPDSALAWWGPEAARRGYIVIAPEYNLPGQTHAYRFSTSEHAAVELALRDARRRYAIDGDRVYLGGQLNGGDMAWDFGLAHPDLFAGVAVISGLPLKYVYKYLPAHVERLPLYVVLGDLAPASTELVFNELLKPRIAEARDVTYVEYYHRGLEALPEEAPAVFDWMEHRRRDPYPKAFEAHSARDSDVRFYGVVIRDFLPGRTTAPEAADPFGKNLNPATIKVKSSRLSNLLNIQAAGVKKLDVWVSPALIDFTKKLEVRVNGKPLKGQAKPSLDAFLEDLRLRGDRQQTYWLKVTAG